MATDNAPLIQFRAKAALQKQLHASAKDEKISEPDMSRKSMSAYLFMSAVARRHVTALSNNLKLDLAVVLDKLVVSYFATVAAREVVFGQRTGPDPLFAANVNGPLLGGELFEMLYFDALEEQAVQREASIRAEWATAGTPKLTADVLWMRSRGHEVRVTKIDILTFEADKALGHLEAEDVAIFELAYIVADPPRPSPKPKPLAVPPRGKWAMSWEK